MQQFDLIIVGGGLAGASLALALRNSRLRIALVESQSPRRPDGWDARIYAVSPANIEFLDSIGAWRHLDSDRICPIRSMEVCGDAGGALSFSAYETGVPQLGAILRVLADGLRVLGERQASKQPHPVLSGSAGSASNFATMQPCSASPMVASLAAPLLVGADGRDSWVRQSAGLAAINTPYGEKGVVANFATEKSHRNCAFQWFRDDGVLAYLPLPGNRISIVWSTPDAHADALCALPAELFCDRVGEAGDQVLGRLTCLTPPAAFPLRLMRVPQTVAPRLALVGDAAHGIHPLVRARYQPGVPGRPGAGRVAGCNASLGRILATSACCSVISVPGVKKRS